MLVCLCVCQCVSVLIFVFVYVFNVFYMSLHNCNVLCHVSQRTLPEQLQAGILHKQTLITFLTYLLSRDIVYSVYACCLRTKCLQQLER